MCRLSTVWWAAIIVSTGARCNYSDTGWGRYILLLYHAGKNKQKHELMNEFSQGNGGSQESNDMGIIDKANYFGKVYTITFNVQYISCYRKRSVSSSQAVITHVTMVMWHEPRAQGRRRCRTYGCYRVVWQLSIKYKRWYHHIVISGFIQTKGVFVLYM